MSERSYLVTGGCGFIGSHLVDRLVASGARVVVLDDLSTGRADNLDPRALLIRGSITDAAAVRRAMIGVDACFHLAAIASVARANEAWAETHRANLSGAINIFEAATARRLPIVYASSAAVYGVGGSDPLDEHASTRPLSAYGADKLGCELHAAVGAGVHGVPTLGLRFFNVFGPRQRADSPYSGVISIFAARALAGQDLVIHGDGGQTRDFIFVEDVVNALVAGMSALASGAPLPPVLNVCTGRAISVLDLAHAVFAELGAKPRIGFAPARPGDIRVSLGDPRAMRQALGVGAPVEFRVALARTLAGLGETKRIERASRFGRR